MRPISNDCNSKCDIFDFHQNRIIYGNLQPRTPGTQDVLDNRRPNKKVFFCPDVVFLEYDPSSRIRNDRIGQQSANSPSPLDIVCVWCAKLDVNKIKILLVISIK